MASRSRDHKQKKAGVIFDDEPTIFSKYRDALLFFGGMGGVVHETILSKTERPTLLILFAAMMGLPAFLRSDERRSGNNES